MITILATRTRFLPVGNYKSNFKYLFSPPYSSWVLIAYSHLSHIWKISGSCTYSFFPRYQAINSKPLLSLPFNLASHIIKVQPKNYANCLHTYFSWFTEHPVNTYNCSLPRHCIYITNLQSTPYFFLDSKIKYRASLPL